MVMMIVICAKGRDGNGDAWKPIVAGKKRLAAGYKQIDLPVWMMEDIEKQLVRYLISFQLSYVMFIGRS